MSPSQEKYTDQLMVLNNKTVTIMLSGDECTLIVTGKLRYTSCDEYVVENSVFCTESISEINHEVIHLK